VSVRGVPSFTAQVLLVDHVCIAKSCIVACWRHICAGLWWHEVIFVNSETSECVTLTRSIMIIIRYVLFSCKMTSL